MRDRGASGMKPVRLFCIVALLLVSCCSFLRAEDPCASVHQRALVLSGGGIKGAFEAGAAYHLVAHRHCDFSEFSGVSVGALNAAFLAQARQTTDATESYANLLNQSEALVALWQSLKSSHDFAKTRPLATVRFGLFGLENMLDFTPLRNLESKNISLEKLSAGRPVRVGVVSFHDGGYREILAKPLLSKDAKVNFFDYLYASSTPPVLGHLPRIPEPAAPSQPQQFADGSLRHITPASSYFAACASSALSAQNATAAGDPPSPACPAPDAVPPHEPVQQLFVIVTSPYSRESDLLPVLDPKCCRSGTRQITDGRKILSRTLDLLDDEVYRWDLDILHSANNALAWRAQAYQRFIVGTSPDQLADAKQRFRTATSFGFESYNRDPADPDAPSLPYEIGLVVPKREFADLQNLLAFSPQGVQEQLYCGCVAADQMMQTEFGLPAMGRQCAERFKPVQSAKASPAAAAGFDPSVCEGPVKPVSHRGSTADNGATTGGDALVF